MWYMLERWLCGDHDFRMMANSETRGNGNQNRQEAPMSVGSLPILTNNVKSMKPWIS